MWKPGTGGYWMKKNEIHLSDHFTYRRLLRYAGPTIMMMIFTSIYGVVDGLFVSNFAGKNAFAAINLIMPVLMILGCFGTMIGTGGTALISKTLGEGNQKDANRYFSMLIEVAVILAVVVSVLGYVLMPAFARGLGATSAMMHDAVQYGRIISLFLLAMIFQYMFASFMNLAEKPKFGLWVTVGAGVTNMVLDAAFVAGLRMGVAGAAIATGLSQLVGGMIPFVYFLLPNKTVLRFKPTKIRIKPVLSSCYNGLSELMTNISASVVSMVYNSQLMKFAGADGVAAYGVIMYVQFIFISAMFGYAFGASPIIGYHYGAEDHRELNNLLRKSMTLEYSSGVVMFIAAELLAQPIAKIFVGYDPELCALTVHAFRIFSLSFLLSGGNIFASAFFTALNNGTVSAVISFVRTLGFELLSVLLLPLVLGLNGIWSAIFVAEIASCIMSWSFIFGQNKKYHYLRSSEPSVRHPKKEGDLLADNEK